MFCVSSLMKLFPYLILEPTFDHPQISVTLCNPVLSYLNRILCYLLQRMQDRFTSWLIHVSTRVVSFSTFFFDELKEKKITSGGRTAYTCMFAMCHLKTDIPLKSLCSNLQCLGAGLAVVYWIRELLVR